MTSMGAPESLLTVAGQVEARLDTFIRSEASRWAAIDPDLTEPLEDLRSMVAGGGKRLRPAFCHWAYVGLGGEPDAAAIIDVGAAFEMLHAFALIHDDVMDGSDRRRGLPTSHRVFTELHLENGWRGESRRFGEGVAILIGNLAHVYADQLVAETSPETRAIWHELRVELNIGQYLDIHGTASGRFDEQRARRIARYKSGRYTIERPLQVGAALAGRADLATELSRYGAPLGEAFQLRDDVLGVFGDPSVTGKPVGDDLREGKPTPMLALAMDAADPAQRSRLHLVGTELSDDDVADLQDILRNTGAVAAIEADIDRLTDEALSWLDTSPLTEGSRAALTDLAHFVSQRSY